MEHDKMIGLGKDPTDYTKNAVEELLNNVFMVEIDMDEYDALIDELGAIVKLELGIDDDERIKWDELEGYVTHYANTLASTLEMSEIVAVLKSIKFKNDDFNDISGKIDTKKIKKQMIDDFKEYYSFDFERLYVIAEK